MKHHNQRIALRLPSKQRQQIDKLVESGKFKNLSEVIREALDGFLCKKLLPHHNSGSSKEVKTRE